MPPAVQTTIHDVLKTPPPNVSEVKRFQYLVGIKMGKDAYELRLDATGDVIQVTPYNDRRFGNPGKWPGAQPNEKASISAFVTKDWQGAQPQEVRVLDPAHNLYYASFTQNGGTGYADARNRLSRKNAESSGSVSPVVEDSA